MLRNSQNFNNAQAAIAQHNRSVLDDHNQKWLMTSADSDNLNVNLTGPSHNSFFIDYPHHSINQTISNERQSYPMVS